MRLFLRKQGCSVTKPMREHLCVDLDGLIQRHIHWGTSCRTIVTHSDGDHARQAGLCRVRCRYLGEFQFDDLVCRDLLAAGRARHHYGLLCYTLV
jgi:hypothetical protein